MMRQQLNILNNTIKIVIGLFVIIFVLSCEETFEFDLPETGSIMDLTLPEANFSYTPNPENFKILKFTNASNEATNYLWDFGEGIVCDTTTVNGINGVIVCPFASDITGITTQKDPAFVKFDAGEGDYEVTLTALDANDASETSTQMVEIRDVFVPINPIIVLGDFESSSLTSTWRITPFTDGTHDAPQSTSDGSKIDYEGNDTGSKTRGMKFHAGGSDPANPGSRRYGYQEITVSPSTADRTVKYVIEYEYAIKVAAAAGSNVTVQILDGHFEDGKDALVANVLATSVSSELLGKGNFTTVKKEFTSNASGSVSVWLSGNTNQDAYVDNVKVYPKP